MKRVNQRILVWLLGFLLLFSAAWVFIGKYIYETAANVNAEYWGNLSNRLDRFIPDSGASGLNSTFLNGGLGIIRKWN